MLVLVTRYKYSHCCLASRISQLELKQQIETLNEELAKVREALNNHPDLDPYVKKLIACKHKVTVVLNVLQGSQVRLHTKHLLKQITILTNRVL